MMVRQGSREATLPIFIKPKSSFCLKQEESHNKRVHVGDAGPFGLVCTALHQLPPHPSLNSCDKSSKCHSKISGLLLKRRKRTIQDDYSPLRVFHPCLNVRGQVRFTETPCILNTGTWIQTILFFFFKWRLHSLLKSCLSNKTSWKVDRKLLGSGFDPSATLLQLVGKAHSVKKKSLWRSMSCALQPSPAYCCPSAGLTLGCESETHKPSFRCLPW